MRFVVLVLSVGAILVESSRGYSSVMSPENIDAAIQLQKRVNQAISDGAKKLFVPAGHYYFGNQTFLIESAKDLTIYCDPPGSATLWNWGWLGAVQVLKCSNFTLKGFTIDRYPTPYIRGHVTDVSRANGSYTFRLAADSPTSLPLYWDLGEERWTYGGGVYAFGPNGTTFPYGGGCAGSFDPSSMEPLGGREYRIRNGCSSALGVGDDFVAITWLGYGYGIGNSSKVTSQDMAIRASPYMASSETDGKGGHVYRNFTVAPGPGRLISVNADGIHSEDVDVGPLIEDSRISRLLDDYWPVWNIQTTIHLQMGNASTTAAGDEYQITLVHPHTADAPTYYPNSTPIVDHQYGTTEPLLRLAPGDKLRFYDPISLTYLGDRKVMNYPQPLDATANTTLGKKADGLWNDLRAPPYHLGTFTKQNYRVAVFRATVFQVNLSEEPPAVANPHLPVPYLVEIDKTRGTGAVIRNSNFSYSTGFFGRFKSSDARIEGNRFAYNGNEELELSMLPNYYEGPIELRNVVVTGNTFQLGKNKSIEEIVGFTIQPSSENISTAGNRIVAPAP